MCTHVHENQNGTCKQIWILSTNMSIFLKQRHLTIYDILLQLMFLHFLLVFVGLQICEYFLGLLQL